MSSILSQKCHLLTTLSTKRKTTIKLTPFRGWDPHSPNCQICDKMRYNWDTKTEITKNTSGLNQCKHHYLDTICLRDLESNYTT